MKNQLPPELFNPKIFECFEGVCGKVLDIGCGGGHLTKFLATKPETKFIVAVDKEKESARQIKAHKFLQLDLDNFDENVFENKFDFVVCRDVLMYLKDIDYTFFKLSKICDNAILLNWHNVEHKNCHNKTKPEDIAKFLKRYYSKVEVSYPDFYKWGYLIKASK